MKIGWGGFSGIHQGEVSSVSQFDGDSDFTLTYVYRMTGARLNKGTVVPASTSVLARTASSALDLKPDNPVSPIYLWHFLSCCPISGAQVIESVSE